MEYEIVSRVKLGQYYQKESTRKSIKKTRELRNKFEKSFRQDFIINFKLENYKTKHSYLS